MRHQVKGKCTGGSGKTAGFPQELYCGKCQRIALQDELLRQFGRRAERFAFKAKGSGKSGLISVSRCRQEVLREQRVRFMAGERKYPS